MDTLVFLVNHGTGLHYFTEVNARLQVKKIIAVEVNEVYLVQTLIRDTEGQLLPDPGLTLQSSAVVLLYSVECLKRIQPGFFSSLGCFEVWPPVQSRLLSSLGCLQVWTPVQHGPLSSQGCSSRAYYLCLIFYYLGSTFVKMVIFCVISADTVTILTIIIYIRNNRKNYSLYYLVLLVSNFSGIPIHNVKI